MVLYDCSYPDGFWAAQCRVASIFKKEGKTNMIILVVDDDPNILQLVNIHLVQAGYEVIKATNGAEALELLKEQHPDLAVVDVMMPGMDGFELTRRLRSEVDIPVLLLTAKGEL